MFINNTKDSKNLKCFFFNITDCMNIKMNYVEFTHILNLFPFLFYFLLTVLFFNKKKKLEFLTFMAPFNYFISFFLQLSSAINNSSESNIFPLFPISIIPFVPFLSLVTTTIFCDLILKLFLSMRVTLYVPCSK